jgi:hypothetical protein
MLVGHYAASYALKAVDREANLGLLFLAVQLLDILSAILVLFGIERWQIVPGITQASSLDLYIPYTHGFLTSLFWAALVYIGVRLWARKKAVNGKLLALVFGIAVWSHWWFDLIVHRPDLPLFDDKYKVGLGLWFNAPATYIVEGALLLAGFWLYMRGTKGEGFIGRYGMAVFVVLLLVVNYANVFGPPPPSSQIVAISAELFYFVAAAIALWIDKRRSPIQAFRDEPRAAAT